MHGVMWLVSKIIKDRLRPYDDASFSNSVTVQWKEATVSKLKKAAYMCNLYTIFIGLNHQISKRFHPTRLAQLVERQTFTSTALMISGGRGFKSLIGC